jgi:hypothetical protein
MPIGAERCRDRQFVVWGRRPMPLGRPAVRCGVNLGVTENLGVAFSDRCHRLAMVRKTDANGEHPEGMRTE